MSKKLSIEEIKNRLYLAHGNVVILDENTYVNTMTKCRFIDKDYGEWWSTPNKVIWGKKGHKKRIGEKSKKTFLKKYGVEHPLYLVSFLDKRKQTCIQKYGVDSPRKTDEVKNKYEKTCLNKYGVINPSQNDEIKAKKEKTFLIKYGVTTPFKNEIIRNKIKDTCLLMYGVDNPTKNKEIRLKAAKSANKTTTVFHWKTNEIQYMVGWDPNTATYFNENKEYYEYEPETFLMPDGRTYTPDFYLPDKDLWVEVKGYFYGDAKEKWEWFHAEHPNSELWDEKKLKELGIL